MLTREVLRQVRRLQLRARRAVEDPLGGAYRSVFKGAGIAFEEVREYQPGDDVRTIDWNVSARMNNAYVKVFVEEREMTVMLVVDLSHSTHFGTRGANKARLAAEVAALCAFSAIKHNDRVGLILSTDQIEKIVPPKKGQKHVMRVVREILGAEPERPGTDLKVALETLYHVARRRSVAFVISDFFATGHERALSLASARHDVIPVMLVDPRDEELPDVGLASFEDLENGESVLIDTSSAPVRAHYKKQMKSLRDTQVKLFRKLGLDHVVVRTDQPYIRPIRDLFARRARRTRR
jgi:uncharacterized protein (DUF58 family)